MSPTERWRGRHTAVMDQAGWEYVTRPGATGVVGIVAVTDDDAIVLVEQSRVPVGTTVIELPAGLAGDLPGHAHEALQVAAERELVEETGFVAAHWSLVSDGPSSAGLTDERIHLFVARGLQRVGPGGGDDSEAITVHVVPLTELQAFLVSARARGALVDHKVLAGAWFAGTPWDGRSLARD